MGTSIANVIFVFSRINKVVQVVRLCKLGRRQVEGIRRQAMSRF